MKMIISAIAALLVGGTAMACCPNGSADPRRCVPCPPICTPTGFEPGCPLPPPHFSPVPEKVSLIAIPKK